MSPEKKSRGVSYRGVGLAIFTAAALFIPGSNPGHTAFVLGAIKQHEADCSYGIQPSNQRNYPYDAIAVPGTDPDSDEWRMRISAANIALAEGLAPEIILLGQKDHSSLNTSTNMKELAEIAKQRNLGKVVLVTNNYHKLRATLLACANGVATASVPAEALLIEQDLGYLSAINDMYSSIGMMWKKIREAIGVALLIEDPTGEIPITFRGMGIGFP